jgi:hypothetical protein
MRFARASLFAVALIATPALACDLPAAGGATFALKTVKPVIGDDVYLTSGFGIRLHPLLMVKKMHAGVDWAAPTGTPVIAAAAGRVIQAGTDGAYGNVVLMDHGGGWQTLYAQLSRFHVQAGACVAAGETCARMGRILIRCRCAEPRQVPTNTSYWAAQPPRMGASFAEATIAPRHNPQPMTSTARCPSVDGLRRELLAT